MTSYSLFYRRTEFARPKPQSGAVLIISLVLLLIMTLLGVSNMRSSTLQLNMAVNSQTRSAAFSAAEFTLKSVESELQNEFHKHDPQKFVRNCNGSGCYNAGCTAGRCFEGSPTWSSPRDCHLDDGSGSVLKEFIWARNDGEVWKNSAKHAVKRVDIPRATPAGGAIGNLNLQAKYIIEFLCYAHKNPDPKAGGLCEVLTPSNCVPLYRVTVLAENNQGQSRVMLQATTKVNP